MGCFNGCIVLIEFQQGAQQRVHASRGGSFGDWWWRLGSAVVILAMGVGEEDAECHGDGGGDGRVAN